jgi:hypothetical protein
MAYLDLWCVRYFMVTVLALAVTGCSGARTTTSLREYCDPVTLEFTLVKAKSKGMGYGFGGEMTVKMMPKSQPSEIYYLSMFAMESLPWEGSGTTWHYRTRIKKKWGIFWNEKMLGFDEGLPPELEEANRLPHSYVSKWTIGSEVQHDLSMETLLPKLVPNSVMTWVIDSRDCQKLRNLRSEQRQPGSRGPPPGFFDRPPIAGPGSTSWEDALNILGLPPKARPTIQEVNSAYKSAALKWHPDKNPSNRDAAEAMFKKLVPARDLLMDYLKTESE